MKQNKLLDRCEVICHMYVSIDGKIDGKYMNEDGCNISGDYYDKVIWQLGNSMAGGRITNCMYHAKKQIDLSLYKDISVPEGDYIICDNHYHFCFDRQGKSMWDSSKLVYGGKSMQNVSVLSSDVKKEYLAYLRENKISYIIVRDIEEALFKIKKIFEIDILVLTGGATINGAFHEKRLIDKLSIVMSPFIEGNHDEKGYAELNTFINNKYSFESIKPLDDGGVHMIFKSSKEN